MTKNSRSWAEPAEQAVTEAINGSTVDPAAMLVAQAIHTYVPNIERAVWKGASDYAAGGDIVLEIKDGTTRTCETKFSQANGSGTAKNLGAKTFTKRINASITGYQEFETTYKTQRYALVESIIGRQPRTASEYCAILRGWRNTDPDRLDQIATITAPGQEAYAVYAAAELNKYLPQVNLFVDSILGNIDTRQLRQDVVYCVTKNWLHRFQTTEFYDFLDMDRTVTHVEAKGKQIKLKNSKNKDVLTISVNWKNICQGGATPSFNVFIGNEFYSND
jgi:hypothetical protein